MEFFNTVSKISSKMGGIIARFIRQVSDHNWCIPWRKICYWILFTKPIFRIGQRKNTQNFKTPTGQKIIKFHPFTFGPHFRIRFIYFCITCQKVQIFLFRPHKQRECEEGSTSQRRYYWNPIRYNSRIKLFQSNVFQRYKKKRCWSLVFRNVTFVH